MAPRQPAVLIAEADEVLAAAYSRYLSRQGYDTQTVATGMHCLERLQSQSFAALVLELELLWGGGDGVLAVLSGDERLARVPVLINSAAPPDFVRSRVAMPPVVQFLQKPFSLSELLACVRLLTGQARVTAPTDFFLQSSPPVCA